MGSDQTNPTIFLRLNRDDARVRQLAWQDFHALYAPAISAFARRLGTREQDVDDVVQDVLTGFFAKSPAFVYDPAKGRFRAYLKTCTYHVICRRAGREARFNGVPLDRVDPEALEVEYAWSDVWERERLRAAVERLRAELRDSKTFRAFDLYVIQDRPAQQVSEELGLHLDSVYRAKEQISKLLRERLRVDED